MRLWKWLKLGFDQTFSGAWWKQLLWLTSVIVFFFAGMYILRPQVGISPQTENVFTSPAEQETQKLNFWDLVELFIDPGGFANQKEVNRPYALLVVLAGMLLLTGIFEYAGTPGGTFPQRRQPLCFFQSHHYIGYRRYGALSDPATPTKCRV